MGIQSHINGAWACLQLSENYAAVSASIRISQLCWWLIKWDHDRQLMVPDYEQPASDQCVRTQEKWDRGGMADISITIWKMLSKNYLRWNPDPATIAREGAFG